MEREIILKLVESISTAKFFGVDKNSQHYKKLIEVVNTISNEFEKIKNEKI